MKIDSKFISDIFSRKIKLTKLEDKIKLSMYEEQIPRKTRHANSE